MAGYLTIAEQVRVARLYSINGENSEMTRKQLYQEGVSKGRWGKFGVDRSPVPSQRAITDINAVFNETGCVEKTLLKSYSKRKKRITAENLQRVREEVLKSPDIWKSHWQYQPHLACHRAQYTQYLKS